MKTWLRSSILGNTDDEASDVSFIRKTVRYRRSHLCPLRTTSGHLDALFYASIAIALTYFGGWYAFLLFWIVPFCTWHIASQYIRLICEHSAVESDEEEYAITRTTIPTLLERIFILPCNVGYHIEHHWYPSVPFYRLPELHRALMERQGFRQHAVVRHSVFTSLGECIRKASSSHLGTVGEKA